ncbi:MAG TPA: HEAT repeat domain-containing protein, partial [Thermoanaerobaculia bacterium]|nr:HEAT repeat domain-containing protein [Thermoanaerobaculia bacterium]
MLEKLRGLRSEPAFVAALREHKWSSEDQKKDLLEKFQALPRPDVEWVAWTAVDQVPEVRAAGLAILKRRHDRSGLEALVPMLKTRSEAVRRAVMRFLKELAGPQLGPFLQEVASRGDDFARLSALELA